MNKGFKKYLELNKEALEAFNNYLGVDLYRNCLKKLVPKIAAIGSSVGLYLLIKKYKPNLLKSLFSS